MQFTAHPEIRPSSGKGENIGNDVWLDTSCYHGCTYQEGDHVMMFGMFREKGCKADVIYTNELTGWQPPYQREPVTEEKRREIISSIQKRARGPFAIRDGQRVVTTTPDALTRLLVWILRQMTR